MDTVLLMAAMSVPERSQSQSQDRFALTAAQVALAISLSGMQLPPSMSLYSLGWSRPSRRLYSIVLSVETLGKGPLAGNSGVRLRVKLAVVFQANA